MVSSVLSLLPELKPVAKKLFDEDVIPLIKKFEDQIPSEVLRQIIEGLTLTVEAQIDKVLS